MPEPLIRVYADTSVYGGVFDEEFARPSREFFDQVRAGRFHLVGSAVVQEELAVAPDRVKEFAAQIWPLVESAPGGEEALRLRRAYIEAGIVTRKSLADALHVALAVTSGCDLIVSWNFKHIVHFQKIPLYNQVNVRYGFPAIAVHSPMEVIAND
jgi:predicted nucleic acid-binding protein